MRTSWMIAAAVLFIALALVGYFARLPGPAVDVIRPRVETIRAYVEEQAVTSLPQDYLIAMPIDGWLEPIALREGDPVEAGQVVAQLDTADLEDRVIQAEQRIAELETRIRETQDNRLELNALAQAEATVQAVEQTVEAAEAKLEATRALAEFAESEVDRLRALREAEAAAEREAREAVTEWRQAEAEYRGDQLELAALKTIEAVAYIGPKFIRDYIDRKTFELETLRTQLAEARAALEIQRRNLARAVITSPITGVVLERRQTRRQFLAAGTPLLTLGRLEDMEIIAEVLTERAPRISPGNPVDVFGEAIPAGPIPGRVLRVYPAGFTEVSSLGVEQQRVNVAVGLDQRPDRLGVNFRVYVRIYYDVADEALTLPRTALFRDAAGGWSALVVREGQTELQPLELGITNEEKAQILAGVAEGDVVIATPSREIEPGMRVQIVAP